MLRRLSLGLLASAISVAALPAIAQEDGSADDLGVMSISLKDVVKPTFGFQGALQGAGTPNQAGIGGFLPLSVGENSVWFLDVLANANFADYENNSSIMNTQVAGTTISTSSRLGYRWLNSDRSWMYGLNAGYDSRPMNTGATDYGIPLFGTERNVFFQQVAVNAEAVSNDWNFNAYALIPVGDTEQILNWAFDGGALDTYGIDVGYFITPALNASVGYYYQQGDLGSADGSGVLGRVAYEVSSGLIAGVNFSYDEAFETRVSADLKVRFGGASTTAQRKVVQQQPVISALTMSPENRDVRVHDSLWSDIEGDVDDVASGVTDVADDVASGVTDAADFTARNIRSAYNAVKVGQRIADGFEAIREFVEGEGLADFAEGAAEACVEGLCEAAAI